MSARLRHEQAQDTPYIAEVVRLAFLGNPHSDGGEPRIIDRLRSRGDLSLSLVAEMEGRIVGHAAFSPVVLESAHEGWYGLGPLAVHPSVQAQGIGSRLVRQGLAELQEKRANGCVVFGNPRYYARFGFQPFERLTYPGGPPQYFLALALQGAVPAAAASYSPAFNDH